MPTITLPLTAVVTWSGRPTTPLGQPATGNLSSTVSMFLAASTAQIPAAATVSSAILTVTTGQNLTGSRSLVVQRTVTPFTTSTTWANRPASDAASAVTVSVGAVPAGTAVAFDVTAIVQQWQARTLPNYGFSLTTPSASPVLLNGAAATSGQPTLAITYSVIAAAPTGLRPQGAAVSLAKPTLTATVGSDVTSIQVQVDRSANATSPAFDSGEVATAGGSYDLSNPPAPISGSTPTYDGLADGASTQHRWRVKNTSGNWSPWSPWASFNRVAWKAFTVNSPATTVEDPSPTASGSYAGTLTSWRIQFLSAQNVVVADSQWQAGASPVFTATVSVGTSGTARFLLRDNAARGATPGDPDYLQVDRVFTVSPSGAPTAPASVSAANVTAASPVTRVTVTRAQIPDEAIIYRDGVQVARLPGTAFTGSGPYVVTWDDYTLPMNRSVTYSARAVVNGAVSNATIAAPFIPSCVGIWLLDPSTQAGVAVWTGDDQDQDQPELAALSRPLNATNAIVRRRLARAPREGAVNGELIDAAGVTNSEATLRSWVEAPTAYDAGHVYRLVLGGQNDPVIVGDVTFTELPATAVGQRVVGVSFSWWWQG